MSIKVSAVMPTRGRRVLAAQALECFLSQAYADKELVILDDIDDRSFPQEPFYSGVRYHLAATRMTIPAKRNAVNALTSGQLIMHFDSDDWSAPERMAEQVARHQEHGKAVTGYKWMWFYDERTGETVNYHMHVGSYALGTSLCYTREFWMNHPFDVKKAIASDNSFVAEAVKAGELHAVDSAGLMVARAHSEQSNASRQLDRWGRPTKDLSNLPAGFVALLGVELASR